MALRPFIKIQNLAYDLSRIQENVAAFVRQLLLVPFLQGVEKIDVSIDLTVNPLETLVEHGLNRAYRGWIITNIDTDTNIWVTATTENNKYLKITAGSDCTLSLWIY